MIKPKGLKEEVLIRSIDCVGEISLKLEVKIGNVCTEK